MSSILATALAFARASRRESPVQPFMRTYELAKAERELARARLQEAIAKLVQETTKATNHERS